MIKTTTTLEVTSESAPESTHLTKVESSSGLSTPEAKKETSPLVAEALTPESTTTSYSAAPTGSEDLTSGTTVRVYSSAAELRSSEAAATPKVGRPEGRFRVKL